METIPRIEARTAPARGEESILLVEDEEELAAAVAEMLSSLGYRVVAQTSGVDALDTFRSAPDEFDLVITDQTMPGITGKELAAEIVRIRPDIPIVLCTGFSDAVTTEGAKGIGIRELVMKPLMLQDLSAMIRRVFDKNGRTS